MKNNYFYLLLIGLAITFNVNAQLTATFEDLTLEDTTFWNGSDGSGEFISGPATFKNHYNSTYNSWSGFAYSKVVNDTTAGWTNQYASYANSGVLNSEKYGVAYVFGKDTVIFANTSDLSGFYVSNSTYAALSMKNGDAYAKKFGGESGDDPDWFKLTIEGWNADNTNIGTVEFYLADYRFDDNSKDYILNTWDWVDLSSLKGVSYLTFSLSSTDNSSWGMNTPAYFCIDNLTVKGESEEAVYFTEKTLDADTCYNGADGKGGFGSQNLFFNNSYNPTYSSWSGWSYSNKTDVTTSGYTNQYSAITGGGANGTDIYAVAFTSSYYASTITLSSEGVVYGTYITNSTYAALSMRDGDSYAKKFGGESGDDPDWFKLTITGYNNNNDSVGAVEFYLADYRFTDNTKDYIVNSWEWVDLSSIGAVRTLKFTLSSTDNGQYGMNTPSYFCLDGFKYATLPEKQIVFKVNDGTNAVEDVAIAFNGETLNTDVNGDVVFSSVSPTVDMAASLTKEGFIQLDTVINGYTVDTINLTIIPTGIADNSVNVNFNVYPNPVVNMINIDADAEIIYVNIYNASGQVIEHTFVNELSTVLPVSELKHGLYIIEIQTEKGIIRQQIIKR